MSLFIHYDPCSMNVYLCALALLNKITTNNFFLVCWCVLCISYVYVRDLFGNSQWQPYWQNGYSLALLVWNKYNRRNNGFCTHSYLTERNLRLCEDKHTQSEYDQISDHKALCCHEISRCFTKEGKIWKLGKDASEIFFICFVQLVLQRKKRLHCPVRLRASLGGTRERFTS